MIELPTSSENQVSVDSPPKYRTVVIQRQLLAKNAQQAELNRDQFNRNQATVINMLSSPGSGKTRLLERTLDEFGSQHPMAVLVGDLQTENDAVRLAGRGHPVVAVTTCNVCHLEAEMIALACQELDLSQAELLVIENVGNLVCPASFDLGEHARVVLLSTTEGEDKPLKYPKAFKTANLVIVTKTDLSVAAGFDRDEALNNIARIAPQAVILELSARTGEGMEAWYAYLEHLLAQQPFSKSAVIVPR